MKIPGRIQSYLDELGLDGGDKAKVKRYIADMGDALPEHPSPKEVEKIVKAAMKSQKVSPGGSDDSDDSDDSDVEDAPKPKKKKVEGEKVEKADKVKVEESKKPLSFKAFISEAVEKKFAITWSKGASRIRAGKTEVCPFRWFDSAGGFDRQERNDINKLEVGEKISFGEGNDKVDIERVADDTKETITW